VKSDIPMQVRRNGKRWCAKPTGGIITIELTQTVYIASEAAKGSCVGKVTLTHEKKHVNLNSAFLKLAPRPIITSLHKNPMTLASSGSAAAASRGAAAALKSVVKKALKAEVEKLKQKQDTVDTPQEYARSRQVCGNKEVDALLK
jgi:hypothetical protein